MLSVWGSRGLRFEYPAFASTCGSGVVDIDGDGRLTVAKCGRIATVSLLFVVVALFT